MMDIDNAIEMIKSKKLSYWEEAETIRDICDTGITQETIAHMIGLNQSSVSNKLRILKLPEEIKDLIKIKGNPERYARTLLKLRSKSQQIEIIEHIAKFGLNVREAEEYIKQYLHATYKLRHEKEFASIIAQGVKNLKAKGIKVGGKKTEREGYTDFIIRFYK